MPTRALTRIVPHLWYVSEAEEAARFYVKIFPKSRLDRVWSLASEAPGAGSVRCAEFRLFGQPFFAMSAGPHDPFNDAVSFRVSCRTQAEVDRYWNAILKNGGEEKACGWIVDKFGVRWQICPVALLDMMADRNKKKAAKVAAEMQRQVKFDLRKLKAAFES
ncbi:MAG TPA: VOC family protein [Steroidobacteraceae bacterium]|nr:VOC family protein [Steroidobacteraceae bacterium]